MRTRRLCGEFSPYCLLGLALIVLPVLLWDATRWAVAPSPWDLATRTYAPLAFAPLAAWMPRLREWGEWVWYLAASPVVWGLAALGWLAALAARHRPPRAMLIIAGWSLVYLALHIVTTVQVWDRYLLPLAPLWAWLLAWPAARLPALLPNRRPNRRSPATRPVSAPHSLLLWPLRPLRLCGEFSSHCLLPTAHCPLPTAHCLLPTAQSLLLLIALCLVPPGLAAARGGLPIGGDHGDYRGLEQAMAWVEAQPGRTVLYHQTLGWHARFYLYEAIRQGQTELRWFGSAVYLADNAAKTPYPPSVLILPDWATPPDLPLHLAMRGLEMRQELRAGRFSVYTLQHVPQAGCRWCVSLPTRAYPWPTATAPAGMSQP